MSDTIWSDDRCYGGRMWSEAVNHVFTGGTGGIRIPFKVKLENYGNRSGAEEVDENIMNTI